MTRDEWAGKYHGAKKNKRKAIELRYYFDKSNRGVIKGSRSELEHTGKDVERKQRGTGGDP